MASPSAGSSVFGLMTGQDQDRGAGAVGRDAGSFLDGAGARLVALAVLLMVLALIVWLNREAILPSFLAADPETVPAAESDDPLAHCFEARAAEIDAMRNDGTINDTQAAQFKGRAEAFCAAQHGQGSGPPLPQ